MKPVALLAVLLSGCMTYETKVVPIPEDDPSTHFCYYVHTTGFAGTRITLGFPILGWIPIVGSYLDNAIKLEWGGTQDVFTPYMEVSEYEKQARALAAARRAAARCHDGLRHELQGGGMGRR